MHRLHLSFGLSVFMSFLLISCQRNPVFSSTSSSTLTGRILYGTESGIWMMNADGSNRVQIAHIPILLIRIITRPGRRIEHKYLSGGTPKMEALATPPRTAL